MLYALVLLPLSFRWRTYIDYIYIYMHIYLTHTRLICAYIYVSIMCTYFQSCLKYTTCTIFFCRRGIIPLHFEGLPATFEKTSNTFHVQQLVSKHLMLVLRSTLKHKMFCLKNTENHALSLNSFRARSDL